MHLDERAEGDYQIYTGALEAPTGDGYIGAVVVRRVRGVSGVPRDAYRDENLAGGHRWPSPADALRYAMSKGVEVVRNGAPTLRC